MNRVLVTGGSGFIGVRTIEDLEKGSHEILNISLSPPHLAEQQRYYRFADLMNVETLRSAIIEFRPTHVIHLAARTDCDETTTVEAGYSMNTEGTRNLLKVLVECGSVQRAVIVSSQFIARPGYTPATDTDFNPETIYGESKAQMEMITRNANLPFEWTIVRPTNIWGPWHPRYPQEFWKIAARGLYVHPGGPPVIRCYGYVGNVVWQILRILEMPGSAVDRKVFYVGDPAGDIYEWANGFCVALSGHPARRVPRPILTAAGLAGDLITVCTKRRFYITSSRRRSMMTHYVVPMERTFETVGHGPFDLDAGISETCQWLRSQGWKTA